MWNNCSWYSHISAHGGDETSNIWISRSIGYCDRSFEWRGLRVHTWKTCMRIWGLPWKLVGKFGSRHYFKARLRRSWMMYAWNEGFLCKVTWVGVCTHICLGVCMHICLGVCMHICLGVCMHICLGVCMHICLGVCMHICISYIHYDTCDIHMNMK